MALVTPVNAARLLGASRIAFGAVMLAVPERVGESWLGEGGTTPQAAVVIRALGVRDALIGLAVAHTAADPERGYRWARTSGIGDAVDAAATLLAAKHLPTRGVAATAAMAGGAAVTSVLVGRWMQTAA